VSAMAHDQASQLDTIDAAVARVRAAAAAAQQLDYGGLAAALEDLAVILGAVRAEDAHRVARALLSSAQHG
jgi:hypothetical protein